MYSSVVVRRLMPFTALKLKTARMWFLHVLGCAPPNAVYGIETFSATREEIQCYTVVRRLMLFTALKRSSAELLYRLHELVVRRLMPFTALKPLDSKDFLDCVHCGCAPPNAVYGIETPWQAYSSICQPPVVRRLMLFTALKLSE